MRVVLDSNVVLSGFFFAGIPAIVLQGWHAGRFRLVLSPSILSEYREAGVALESRYGGSEFEAFAALLALHAELGMQNSSEGTEIQLAREGARDV